MKKDISLNVKIKLVFGLFILGITLCWCGFYHLISNSMEAGADYLIEQVSGRVSDVMDGHFSELEQTTSVLSNSNEVVHLLSSTQSLAEDPIPLQRVVSLLNSIYLPNGLVEHILIFDTEGGLYPLRGELNQLQASDLWQFISTGTTGQSQVSLSGEDYLANVVELYQNDVSVGYIAFLIKSSQLQDYFSEYDISGLLHIDLVANGVVVASNHSTDVGLPVETLPKPTGAFVLSEVQNSTFSVLVQEDNEVSDQFFNYFILAELVTIGLLLTLVFLSYWLLHTLFFRPMLTLIQQAKTAETTLSLAPLPSTGEPSFDLLTDQINQLMAQLEERTQQMIDIEHDLQRTEVERQTALIVSLKKQINAHFTVNILTVIRHLNQLGKTEQVGQLCDGLAYLLRYAHDGDASITCAEEAFVLEQYITMMEIRYPHRFTATVDMDSAIEDRMIPRMLLQPLLENAILHGFANGITGRLQLTGCGKPDGLHFIISDNGRGMDSEQLLQLQQRLRAITPTSGQSSGLEHIALENIQKRIVTQFGTGYGLRIHRNSWSGILVEVHLPL